MGARLAVRSCWARGDSPELVYEFDQPRVVFGRAASADVQLPHAAVSAQHAHLEQHGAGYAVVDDDSTNGTKVNGTRIAPGRPKPLRSGDRVELGGFVVVVTTGLAVPRSTNRERTSALARRLVREALGEGSAEVGPPTLRVVAGPDEGAELVLPPPPARLVIGRGEGCDLMLTDADVSREHVELTVDLDGVVARDLGSKNGMAVLGVRRDEHRLSDRDEVMVGSTVLVFEDPAALVVEDVAKGEDVKAEPPPPPEPPSEPEPPAEAAAPGADTPSAAEAAPVVPAGPRGTASGAEGGNADVVIYVLAAVVLVASLAGLFVLLGSG